MPWVLVSYEVEGRFLPSNHIFWGRAIHCNRTPNEAAAVYLPFAEFMFWQAVFTASAGEAVPSMLMAFTATPNGPQ